MKKIIFSTLFTLLTCAFVLAQDYTTPNTGVTWTLDDIAAASPTTVTISGSNYTLLGNLTIAANDAVIIDSDLTLLIAADKLITVFGAFTIDSNSVTITALDENAPYEGFRFEEFSEIDINNATIQYGGGLRVLTETFSIDNCTIINNVSGATTSAAIQLSRGMPQITNNTISFNDNPAIGSAANSAVSAFIFNNTIEGNNKANSNRPQINLGTTLANEPLQIIQNTIIGDSALDQAGGIAVANFVGGNLNVIIATNTIRGNRYGITILGINDSVEITNNIIEDNNIQGDPNLGGSGINLNSSTVSAAVVVSGNEIRRNLWGITLQGSASINLGDDATNPGNNIFAENENGGETYALYNNTANTISAKNNCWIEGQQSTEQQVEDVIFHSVDDPTLGEVIFNPFLCGVLGIADNTVENFSFYPNPAKNEINFNNIVSFEKVEIFGIQGNLIIAKSISEGQNTLPINLPSGLYFVNFSNDAQTVTKKMIVQ
ncbi:T9SS type A sorting domain-containing protein [Aequorivita lipolytica]|uniref:T9SS type A sorting domain-containing protein n=1 Tax=Aequorivita lipolytica TaxID=153267 RepID=A0A5C6YUY7_9FLAO|nr:T9SS type A sorting domain-containing protein [Aequorivita lipolytica]TXD70753.1 T9SS type A sorting domain-containing protein [Aequorivita lipolytica]